MHPTNQARAAARYSISFMGLLQLSKAAVGTVHVMRQWEGGRKAGRHREEAKPGGAPPGHPAPLTAASSGPTYGGVVPQQQAHDIGAASVGSLDQGRLPSLHKWAQEGAAFTSGTREGVPGYSWHLPLPPGFCG